MVKSVWKHTALPLVNQPQQAQWERYSRGQQWSALLHFITLIYLLLPPKVTHNKCSEPWEHSSNCSPCRPRQSSVCSRCSLNTREEQICRLSAVLTSVGVCSIVEEQRKQTVVVLLRCGCMKGLSYSQFAVLPKPLLISLPFTLWYYHYIH